MDVVYEDDYVDWGGDGTIDGFILNREKFYSDLKEYANRNKYTEREIHEAASSTIMCNLIYKRPCRPPGKGIQAISAVGIEPNENPEKCPEVREPVTYGPLLEVAEEDVA
jgi:hypothetical protein